MTPHRSPRRWWRLATLAAFAGAGALAITSSLQSGGLDLRATSVTDLHTLVQQRRDQVDAKQARAAELANEVKGLSAAVDDTRSQRLTKQVEKLRDPAGFTARSGPGLQISLDDTPNGLANDLVDAGTKSYKLVVHQQDIQAVVNALWSGGAQGVSLMGQRVISTTGIKCVGNTVAIKGVLYAPPYRIEAVGDPTTMRLAVLSNAYVRGYLSDVKSYGLGWSLEEGADLTVPGYSGAADLTYAKPAPRT